MIERVWNGLRRLDPMWEKWCAHGTPIPDGHECSRLDCPSRKLSELSPGAQGTVSCLDLPDSPRAQRLVGMGILPGAPIELLQTFPAFVFRIGNADFAVDRELAGVIRVRVEEAAPATAPAAT